MPHKYSQQIAKVVRPSQPRRPNRRALSTLEVLASASILTIVISFFVTLSTKIQRLTKDVQKDQTALHELANLLEEEIAKRSPTASAEGSLNLPPIPIEGLQIPTTSILSELYPRGGVLLESSSDSVGDRLTISFFRDSEQIDALPVSLTGWIRPSPGATP